LNCKKNEKKKKKKKKEEEEEEDENKKWEKGEKELGTYLLNDGDPK